MTRAGRQHDYINVLFLLRNKNPPQTSAYKNINKPVVILIILYRKSIKAEFKKNTYTTLIRLKKAKSVTKLQVISETSKQETWSRHYVMQNVALQILFSSLCGQTNSFVVSPELFF